MLRIAAAVLAALIMSGCAVKYDAYAPEKRYVDRPPLGQTTIVGIGDELLAKGVVVEGKALNIKRLVDGALFDIHPGVRAKVGDKGAEQFFEGTGVRKSAFADDPDVLSVKTPDAKQVCVVTITSQRVCYDADFAITDVSYEQEASFQQTLLYNGRVGNKIRIGYREFSNSRARPAFNNEVEYDLSTSNRIGYKGAELEVLNADNTSITYRVISTFR